MLNKLLLIMMMITMTGCHNFNQVFGIRDDDPIELELEEVAVELIEHETGVHIHLSPPAPVKTPEVLPCDQVQIPYKP